ncbi:putative glutamate--cysteine ligase 2 [Reticulibacter mediterranei]|uniref:Putative glutamate--cysteine ligase 2 n=1 Tax=Reticulibacter mediterranei TaxID=2778369 RepID=A0A8J3N4N0_9CHLR|nr:carboxylate-amine ligase [Reticulibacter mediterranei]GHO98214.1 putative glutamate--cysteine ligase 2 [Reticulibacter mediterranei]
MTARFTIGIEEEFQMVDRYTGQLVPHIQTILEKGHALFGDQIKAEMLQPTVELISDILPDISTARHEMSILRSRLAHLLDEEGLALISAGTHPAAWWQDEPRTPYLRYIELEEEFQDVARSLLIFGLHIHIGVENQAQAVMLMNQLRTWLPHLLALSSNSPLWKGRQTGLKSYRSIIWRPFPRSGVPEVFPTWHDFDSYVHTLINTGCIDNGKRIWWDIRPHPFFSTIEFRICDMPATINDTIALAALCQALVAKVALLNNAGVWLPMLPSHFIEENKWRALRFGLDAQIIDFELGLRLSMRDSIRRLLDFVDDMLDDLGSRAEIDYLRSLLDGSRGTGADQQLAIYQQTGSIEAVLQFLMQQAMIDIPVHQMPPDCLAEMAHY